MFKSILAKIYSSSINRRNRAFDQGRYPVHQVKVPVISIGNLSVGGTGKTPFTEFLCKELKKLSILPGIIGRGYKRESKGEVIVCDGKNILTDTLTAGDEMFLLAEKTNVPIVVHDKKYMAAKSIEEKFEIDCILVDDGFQHRHLKRDLDIVILDKNTLENPHLMPRGRLREPLSSLSRADIIALTPDSDISLIPDEYSDKLIVEINVNPGKPYSILNGNIHEKKTDVIAVSGIAKPERFKNLLDILGFKVIDDISFADHYNYSDHDIRKIYDKAKQLNVNIIATTEKDMVKLRSFSDDLKTLGLDVLAFPIRSDICKGKHEFMNKVLSLFGKENEKSQ